MTTFLYEYMIRYDTIGYDSKFVHLTSELYEVYTNQPYLVPYSLALLKRMESVTRGVLSRWSPKIVFFFDRDVAPDP